MIFRAENEIRTRDPQLGKLMLYRLSYFRNKGWESPPGPSIEKDCTTHHVQYISFFINCKNNYFFINSKDACFCKPKKTSFPVFDFPGC